MTDEVRGSDGSCGICGGGGIILPVIPPIHVPCQHNREAVTYLVDSSMGRPTVSGCLIPITVMGCPAWNK